MRNKAFNIVFAVIAVLSMTFTSCASHKESAGVLSQENIIATGSLSVKFGDNEQTAPSKLSISRGKIVRLQVMMPLLGSELIRLEFTPDDVLVLDRMNKRYIKEKYDMLNVLTGANLSYPFVQALVIDYLAKQDELKLSLPASGKPVDLLLQGNFKDIKAEKTDITPTEVTSKFSKMQISDLTKMMK